MERCVFQVIRQHQFHQSRGKQSVHCVERRVHGLCSRLSSFSNSTAAQSFIVFCSLDLFIDLIGRNDDLMKTTQTLQIHTLVHRSPSSPGQPPLNSLMQTVRLDISDTVRLYSIFIFLLSQTKPITQAPLPLQIVKARWKE